MTAWKPVRLSWEDAREARWAFEDHNERPAERIVYRDDFDAQKSYFKVVDADGNDGGSGEWFPVPSDE